MPYPHRKRNRLAVNARRTLRRRQQREQSVKNSVHGVSSPDTPVQASNKISRPVDYTPKGTSTNHRRLDPPEFKPPVPVSATASHSQPTFESLDDHLSCFEHLPFEEIPSPISSPTLHDDPQFLNLFSSVNTLNDPLGVLGPRFPHGSFQPLTYVSFSGSDSTQPGYRPHGSITEPPGYRPHGYLSNPPGYRPHGSCLDQPGCRPHGSSFPPVFPPGYRPHGFYSNLQPDNPYFNPFASTFPSEPPHIPHYASMFPTNEGADSTTPSTKYSAIGKDRFKHDDIIFVYERKLPMTHIPKSEVADDQFEKRWPKIRTIYAVQQGPYQFGAALHLRGPHYQVEARALEERLESYSGKISVISVNQTDTYEDDFICVENTISDKSFAWDLIGTALATFPSDNKKSKITGNHRQRTFVDIGICSNLCQAPDSLGVWGPNTLVNTDSTIARPLFEAANKLRDVISPKFSQRNSSVDTQRSDYVKELLGFESYFETLRCHETQPGSLCEIHTDDHNGNNEGGYSNVFWCSRLVPSAEWRRQGMVAYTRASIEHYLRTKNANFEYLNDCRHKLLSMPRYRSDYTKETLTKSQALEHRFTSVGLQQIGCNLNPEVYYQPFLSIVCNMVERYDLDYESAVGVLLASYMAPSSAFFAYIAAHVLMAVCEPHTNFNAGFALQHTIASMAPHVKMGDGGVKNRYPPFRFGKYYNYKKLHPCQWEDILSGVCRIFRSSMNFDGSPADYRRDCNLLSDLIPQMEDLCVHHLVGIASLLGLCNASYFQHRNQHSAKAWDQIKLKLIPPLVRTTRMPFSLESINCRRRYWTNPQQTERLRT